MAIALKVSDLSRTAMLLKKLVERSDVNKDGAVRWEEARWGVDRKKGLGITHKGTPPGTQTVSPAAVVEAAMRFSQSKGSSEVVAIKKSIDELVKRARAADRDGDGMITEVEMRRMPTAAEQQLVMFGSEYAHESLSDFNLPVQHDTRLPPFSPTGTAAKVCTSLLNAFSDRKNDNFWGSSEGASRFVLGASEAKKMLTALKPLAVAKQKAIITELARRTLKSEFGCVSVDPPARAAFVRYAATLGLTKLELKSPAAPKAPPR
jgi:hypothetical protein